MIDRYTRKEMAALWSSQHKFEVWLKVELAATEAWEKLGVVPAGTTERMRANASFTVQRIDEIEASMCFCQIPCILTLINGFIV